jgi:hypothetical protein
MVVLLEVQEEELLLALVAALQQQRRRSKNRHPVKWVESRAHWWLVRNRINF